MTDLHLDAHLMEQLEQLAAGQAMDVNQFLAEAVRSYLRQVEQEAMQANVTAFLARRPELLKTYPNEYIAFYQGELVDHDIDFLTLHRRVRRQFGRQPVLLRQVNSVSERILTFRSPRFTRSVS
jgi:hypothetical protein